MIGSLHGIVELCEGSVLLVNVNGIGYEVFVPSRLISAMHIGDKIDLFTYTHVREDALELYGFSTREEMRLFKALINVSGIGPKTALGVFSIGTQEQIIHAIQKADVVFFTKVPRLGKKNAQKLIIELKNKVGSLTELDLSGQIGLQESEVLAALKSFGFSQKEAEEAVNAVGQQGVNTSAKIRLALKYLGK